MMGRVLGWLAGGIAAVGVGVVALMLAPSPNAVPRELAPPETVSVPPGASANLSPDPAAAEGLLGTAEADDAAQTAAPSPAIRELRVEADGLAVIAGTGAPGEDVAILLDSQEIARVPVGPDGQFAAIVAIAPAADPRMMTLLADPGGTARASDETVLIAPTVAAMAIPEPEATEPVAAVLAQAAPTPGEPVPGEPVPGEPVPGEPLPGEPVPGEPLLGEPLPSDPVPSDPASTDGEVRASEPAGVVPAQREPSVPAPTAPVPTESVSTDPASTDPASADPALPETAPVGPGQAAAATTPFAAAPPEAEPAVLPATPGPATADPATSVPADPLAPEVGDPAATPAVSGALAALDPPLPDAGPAAGAEAPAADGATDPEPAPAESLAPATTNPEDSAAELPGAQPPLAQSAPPEATGPQAAPSEAAGTATAPDTAGATGPASGEPGTEDPAAREPGTDDPVQEGAAPLQTAPTEPVISPTNAVQEGADALQTATDAVDPAQVQPDAELPSRTPPGDQSTEASPAPGAAAGVDDPGLDQGIATGAVPDAAAPAPGQRVADGLAAEPPAPELLVAEPLVAELPAPEPPAPEPTTPELPVAEPTVAEPTTPRPPTPQPPAADASTPAPPTQAPGGVAVPAGVAENAPPDGPPPVVALVDPALVAPDPQAGPLVAPTPESPARAPVLVTDADGVRLLQPAIGPGATPEVIQTVALDAISYDALGEVRLSGRAIGAGFVRIYIDNAPVAAGPVEGGEWDAVLPDVPPGVYTMRVDQLDDSGEVVSRIETPFQREARESIAAAMAGQTGQGFGVAVKTVQPGHTLWAIARERYGEGIMYVEVFAANRDRIRNADLIYPGQVFVLPELPGESAP